MNAFRLSIGWVFLTALTAAGTFYATDEIDQRVGLEKYQLHQKLGIARYGTAAVTKPTVNPAVNPPLNPPPHQGPAVGPPNQPGGNPVSPAQIPFNAPPSPVQTYPDPNVPNPGGNNSGPTTSIPSRNGVLPYQQYQPPPSRPAAQQFNPPPAVAQNNNRQGLQQQQIPVIPSSRSGDYNEVADRMKTVRSDAEAAVESWEQIRRSLQSMNQPLRPAISSALSQMKRFTRAAEDALRAGDLATARHNLEQSEKQLEILRQFKE